MTARHQLQTSDGVQPYCKLKGYLGAASEGRHGLSGKPPLLKALLLLSLVATVLLLSAQPAFAAPTITEFRVPSPGIPQGITAGSDGALWFTLAYDNEVGRVTTKGAVTVFTLNATLNAAEFITAGPDGALWFTLLNGANGSDQIGRLTTSGKLTLFTVPRPSWVWDITTGLDGNLYVTDSGTSKVWRVTTSGKFTKFPFTDSTGGYPWQLTKGPDGNLWFTDRADLIVKMTTAGKFTTFKVPGGNGSTDDITTGPDGNLWFTFDGTQPAKIGRITTSGVITLFTLPNPKDYLYVSGIAAGPDGNLWFTYQDGTTNTDAIGRITTRGVITLFPTPTATGGPTDITAGSDGAMWFTEAAYQVGRITTG